MSNLPFLFYFFLKKKSKKEKNTLFSSFFDTFVTGQPVKTFSNQDNELDLRDCL